MSTKFRGAPGEVRALDAFIALARAVETVERRTQDEFVRAGLTEGQFGVLEALHHLGPLCAAELAEKILRTRGNLTLVLTNLERERLVARRRREDDRRYWIVALTPRGRRLVAGIFPRHARLVERAFSPLAAAEQDELRRLCRKLGTGEERP